MPNEFETEVIRKVVVYLRKEAAKFDKFIEEAEALGEDATGAKVKRMSIGVMADRVERGDWKGE